MTKNKKVKIDSYSRYNNKSLDLDCMLYGMGSNCLQYTFEIKNFDTACYI